MLASDSIPEVNKSYTVKVGSIPQPIASTLNKGDIIKLFGAFEPFNIAIHKEEPKEKGGEPVVTATFQVRPRKRRSASPKPSEKGIKCHFFVDRCLNIRSNGYYDAGAQPGVCKEHRGVVRGRPDMG